MASDKKKRKYYYSSTDLISLKTATQKRKDSLFWERLYTLYTIGQEPERVEFLDNLFSSLHRKGKTIKRIPIVDKEILDLYNLFKFVTSKGGSVKVTCSKQWSEIGKLLKINNRNSRRVIKNHYTYFLKDYEEEAKTSQIQKHPVTNTVLEQYGSCGLEEDTASLFFKTRLSQDTDVTIPNSESSPLDMEATISNSESSPLDMEATISNNESSPLDMEATISNNEPSPRDTETVMQQNSELIPHDTEVVMRISEPIPPGTEMVMRSSELGSLSSIPFVTAGSSERSDTAHPAQGNYFLTNDILIAHLLQPYGVPVYNNNETDRVDSSENRRITVELSIQGVHYKGFLYHDM